MSTSGTAAQTKTGTCIAHTLAQYAKTIKYDALPQSVVQEAKRRIIDSLGCALGAIDDEPVKIARTVAKTITGQPGATVLGTTHQSSPFLAAYANGVAVRYHDFNDTYLSKEPAHPSDNIPAILAVAEAFNCSGKDVLAAIVLAYEIQCRLCDAVSVRARGWDHVTYIPISSGVAIANMLGLSEQQLVHTIGLAANESASMRQTRVGELSHWKGSTAANSAKNGAFAALLAKEGMSGPSEIFEGEMAFKKQIAGEFDWPTFGSPNSEDLMILKTYVKHFAAEYHSQSAIEAALTLRPQLGGVENIESVVIESFDAAVDIIAGFKEHWRPQTKETADHSMPYMVSRALMDGDVTLDTYTPEKWNDPALLTLIDKVKVVRNDEMNAGYPEAIPNRLIITLKDGKTLTEKVSAPLGHNKNPMQDADIEKKFRPMAEAVLPKPQVDKILDSLWKFESCQDIGSIMSLFNRES
ncbi:MAG: MmgE/PrpD family protein [Vampirovibrio sp.]|nr:MmgE/PrpD family protein [Vampirovibrio sp.]